MNKYQITKREYHFLVEMLEYLNEAGNTMSDDATKEVKDVLTRISSRPVVDIIIDSSVLGDLEEKEDGK